MTQKTIKARFLPRTGTAAEFSSKNPVLLLNELVIEKDTGKKKLGDGVTAYNNLPYLEKTNWSEIVGTPNTFAPAEHTHNYAGSSSAGGAATSANKINTNAGSATQPVYFANGVPVKTTYTLGASVPSGAKFTDTVYTHPATHAASMITGLATVATSGSYDDLTNKPAALPADGGDADTVTGFTVGCNVPSDAKFTDTIYTLPNATASVLGGVKVGTNISVSSGTISVANASTSTKGVVKLSSSTSSTSTSLAATASAVKSAYDLANEKQNAVELIFW